MNRRQRKKNHVGEFARYGFEVRVDLGKPISFAHDAFWDPLIEFIESKDLRFGGGENREGNVVGFITAMRGKRARSCTNKDRIAVARWLSQHPGVENTRTGPLVDAGR